MFNFLQSALYPERFHGFDKEPPFFEGWYYKIVDPSEQTRLAVIPGVLLSADESKQHAFIQVLDGQTGEANYHSYPMQKFWAARDKLDIRIGPNRFTADYLALELEEQGQTLSGTVRFEGTTPWPVTLTSPGIMGWYGWLPFIEFYHGVVSLDHALRGTLALNGEQVDFTGGRGYVEKDWGKSSPSGYIWMQSNHFEEPGTSLTASVAIIPWGKNAFRGFIIGFWHAGELYRFATYTDAKEDLLEVDDGQVRWSLKNKRYRLELQADRAAGGLLHLPTRTEMHKRLSETMQASVNVRLTSIDGGQEEVIFAGLGRNAGLEVYGDLERLLAV